MPSPMRHAGSLPESAPERSSIRRGLHHCPGRFVAGCFTRVALLVRAIAIAVAIADATAHAATLQVGPGKAFATIAAGVGAAQAGDTVEIDAGIYPNETLTVAKNGLTLRGIGGRAHLKWGTGNYLTNTATIGNGKALIIVAGNDITIENLEFSGAKVSDENGAGIRYEGGNLTIRGSHFHDNENGILGQGALTSTLVIEHSIFERNGYCPSSCAHNVYVGHMAKFVFRFNKTIDSREGHTLKSRANVTEVVANYFSTRNSDGSYEADFPNGGTVYFIGNVVEQGVQTGNSILLAFGQEGATNPGNALFIVNNTFVNLKGTGAFIAANGSPALTVRNNVFAGGGSIGASADASNKVLGMSTFVDAAGGDYRLAAGSAAIDAGVNPGTAGAYDLTPQWEYREPAAKAARTMQGAALDAGAYEYATAAAAKVLDIDGNDRYDALTDGLLLIRYLFGLTGLPLVDAAIGTGASRMTPDAISDYVANIRALVDIDGDGRVDALTDGLLVCRYLFGLRGVALINGALAPGAIRLAADAIEAQIATLKP